MDILTSTTALPRYVLRGLIEVHFTRFKDTVSMTKTLKIAEKYSAKNHFTFKCCDCLDFLRTLPDKCAQLILTSPPYNIGKDYEKRSSLESYLAFQAAVIEECVRICRPGGSICWQVGNHISRDGTVLPLDIALYPLFAQHTNMALRNRIVWSFRHGLHCKKRFSGRHETVLWFSKGKDYTFNLDAVRVPQRYPAKTSYRDHDRGRLTCNPKGKNPGDVWDIPNVKGNHVEKMDHPCQFPIALAENLILATTNKRQLIVDPFLGSGTTAVAAIKNGRRSAGAEIDQGYAETIFERLALLQEGVLPYRPRTKQVDPPRMSTKIIKAAA